MDPVTHIDNTTWTVARRIMHRAAVAGKDPIEALYAAGLILTPAKEAELRIGGMEFLHRETVSWRPAEFIRMKFLPSHPASPADMYSCMVEFMERHIAAAKEKARERTQ
jgi:hypothetical protein